MKGGFTPLVDVQRGMVASCLAAMGAPLRMELRRALDDWMPCQRIVAVALDGLRDVIGPLPDVWAGEGWEKP